MTRGPASRRGRPRAAQPSAARTVSLPVSKATIASRLSLTPEYFSRVLHDLTVAGLISVEGRTVRVPLNRTADLSRIIKASEILRQKMRRPRPPANGG